MTKPLTKEEKEARAKARVGKTKPKSEKKGRVKKTKTAKADGEVRQGKELDPRTLSPDKAKKMLGSIHKLEKTVEKKQRLFDLASKSRRAAKAELEQAQDDLRKEIQDQRFGPGPLFGANPETLPSTTASEESQDGDDEGEAA